MNAHQNILQAGVNEHGMRIERFIQQKIPHLSKIIIAKWLRTGQIRLNGKRIKIGHNLNQNDQVRLPPQALNQAADSAPRLARAGESQIKQYQQILNDMVIYRHEDFIVLNKPNGLSVQGGSKVGIHLDQVMHYVDPELRLVHRLDRDTSGFLLIAKNARAARALTSCFKSKNFKKCYWAIVHGAPRQRQGVINLPISKATIGEQELMVVDHDTGLEASTSYRVLAQKSYNGQKLSWLELSPLTGRTHQLRVHCQSLGCPIVGDRKYGDRTRDKAVCEEKISLQLHAYSIDLGDLYTPRLEVITASPPERMNEIIESLNNP